MTAPAEPTIDTAAIQAAIKGALLTDQRKTGRIEMDARADALCGYIADLLPAAKAMADRMWRGSGTWYLLASRISEIEHQVARGLGDDAFGAHVRLRTLAFDTQWLLTHHGPH